MSWKLIVIAAALLTLVVLAGCVTLGSCGDKVCGADENSSTCSSDCTVKACPKTCNDSNPCTRDSCGEETGFKCVNESLSGNQSGCMNEKCTGKCLCTDDASITCSSAMGPGTCKNYACEAGSCIAKPVSNCCGNGVCEESAGENNDTCSDAKAGDCKYEEKCGNNICGEKEFCGNCANDCGDCLYLGYMDSNGLQASYLTTKKEYAGEQYMIFESSPTTLYQYTRAVDENALAQSKDKLQNYCVNETGATCQRVDVFSLLKNRYSSPLKELTFSYSCENPENHETVLDSANGYATSYLSDWNILGIPQVDKVWFAPEGTINLDSANIQAKASFYLPADTNNADKVNVLLASGASEGTKLLYLAPGKKVGLAFNLMTMAPPNNNLIYTCTIGLKGKFDDGLDFEKKVTASYKFSHPNLLCSEMSDPGTCKSYVYRNGRCVMEWMENCCGNGTCEFDANENYANCAETAGGDCSYEGICGNGTCDENETTWACPSDCSYPLTIGIFESDNNTILAGFDGFNGDLNTTKATIDLNGSPIILMSSNDYPYPYNYFNACGASPTQTCQTVDIKTELKNTSEEAFTSIELDFTCTEPDGTAIFMDSGNSSETMYLDFWTESTSPTGKLVKRVDSVTAPGGQGLKAQYSFIIPSDMAAYNGSGILLNNGGLVGTKTILLKPGKVVDISANFLSSAPTGGSPFLYKCKMDITAQTEYGNDYSKEYVLYLKAVH